MSEPVDKTTVRLYTQKGFAVISDTPGMPLFHAFFTPEWEAKSAIATAENFPEHLRLNMRAIPAELRWEE